MIVAEQLATVPGTRPEVSDLTFVVRRGETFGLHGERRDGVVLVLRLLAGTATPARGRVTVDGLAPAIDAAQLAGRLLLLGPDEGDTTHLPPVEVLLLDSPDDVTDQMVAPGRTVVVASPDASLLHRHCDRGISLRDGRVTHRWSTDGPLSTP